MSRHKKDKKTYEPLSEDKKLDTLRRTAVFFARIDEYEGCLDSYKTIMDEYTPEACDWKNIVYVFKLYDKKLKYSNLERLRMLQTALDNLKDDNTKHVVYMREKIKAINCM